MFYRLIVIEKSLKDKSILEGYKILSQTIFGANDPSRSSPMLKVQIPEKDVDEFVEKLERSIAYPYYFHLYHEDPKVNKLIVVFEGKRIDTKKDNYNDAVEYGLKHDVSKEELNIVPRNIDQEEW